jgi:hypothetical protein
MTKQRLTEEQILNLLIRLNPRRLGTDADPIIAVDNSFTFTGQKKKLPSGIEYESYVNPTVITPAGLAANPGLKPGRYMRIMKTNHVIMPTKPGEKFHAPRPPLAENLFENQNTELFAWFCSLLKDKDIWFIPMEPDRDGNPRIKLSTPVVGAFVTINYPAHYRVDKEGGKLSGSSRDLAGGKDKYMAREAIAFNSMTFFLFDYEFDNLQAKAINTYKKLIQPMLVKEVVVTELEGGIEIGRKVKSPKPADVEEPADPNKQVEEDYHIDEMGVLRDKNGQQVL